MTHTHRRGDSADAVAADRVTLLEIADVLDAVCAARSVLESDVGDDTALRTVLFGLLDQPTQERWEEVCEVEVIPGHLPGTVTYLPGMVAPSPLGLTVGDIVYAFGLPDLVCPSRRGLLHALGWAVGAPGLEDQD